MRVVIYGAQGIALGTYNAVKELHPDIKIERFLVTQMDINAPVLGGIPVQELEEFVSGMSQMEKEKILVLIGTPESVMEAIEANLEQAGLYNYARVDSLRWADLQKMAFIKKGMFMPLEAYPVGSRKANLHVYKMVHYKDKQLQTRFQEPKYFHAIQVGAALTDMRIADLADCEGENISEKNGNYSELTGLYWMWRNVIRKELEREIQYFGLAHYRRMLELSEDDCLRLFDNDIDVVLPYPMPYEPNIEAHHNRYLTSEEWTVVLQALEELQPEYAEEFTSVLRQGYLYNYNIILAKGNVLDNYCEWLFPLLFRIEEIHNPGGVKIPNRYIGYVGETLETLYFMYNQKKLKIAHAGCRFLL